jgi:hypothetical protein
MKVINHLKKINEDSNFFITNLKTISMAMTARQVYEGVLTEMNKV